MCPLIRYPASRVTVVEEFLTSIILIGVIKKSLEMGGGVPGIPT